MYGVFIMLLANFKKRKLQSVLTAIIIMSAAIMFSTAINVSTGIKKPFEEMYRNLNASQIQLANIYGVYDTEKITQWWEKNKGITVQNFKFHYSTDRLIFNGKTLSDGSIFFTEKPDKELKQDMLAIVDGEKKNCPSTGEVWVCITFAQKHKVGIGDFLKVSTKNGMVDKKVSAIVADPQLGAASIGILRIWVAPDELQKMFDVKRSDGDFIGIHFDDYSKKAVLWDQFEDYLGKPYSASIFDYELISTAYLMQYQIMGSILLAFAFVLLGVAIFIIIYTISAAVIADVKNIGIIKSQGFTPFSVTVLYALQYTILSIVSVPVGNFCSVFIVNTITDMLARSMGVPTMATSFLVSGSISFVIMVSTVAVVSFVTARKAGKMKPVSAIREEVFGIKNVNVVSFKRLLKASVPMLIALRQLFTQKGQTFIIALSTLAVAAVMTFSFNLMNTFSDRNFNQEANQWGFDKRNDTLVFNESADKTMSESLLSSLRNDKRLKAILPAENLIVPTSIDTQNGISSRNVSLSAFDGDMSELGIVNIEGRNPVGDNEVSINARIKNEYKKRIGEFITVSIAGKKKDLLITGVYQSVLNSGWNIRVQRSVVTLLIPGYNIYSYALLYNNAADRINFTKEYTEKYGSKVDIQPYDESINGIMYGIKSGINSFVMLLGGIFSMIMLIVVFNLAWVNIHRGKKSLGIFKAIGMTSIQIRMTVLWRNIVPTVFGSIVGILLSYFSASKVLMEPILSQMGMVHFPMVPTTTGMLAVIPICLFISFVSSWIPSGKIRSISPRDLILE